MSGALPILLALLLNAPVEAADITLTTTDGKTIHAVFEAANRAGGIGVVLVHAEQRSSSDWKFMATRLAGLGYNVIAPDIRGHGANVPAGTTPAALDELSWASAVNDVQAAMTYLRTKKVPSIGIVGASFGGTLALEAASTAQDVSAVVLLSPLMNQYGLSITSYMTGYGARPLLVVASQEDQYSAKTALVVDAQATGPKQMEVYQGAGHGTTMLNREPSLEGLIVSWLSGSRGISASSPAEMDIGIGTSPAIETTGPSTFKQ